MTATLHCIGTRATACFDRDPPRHSEARKPYLPSGPLGDAVVRLTATETLDVVCERAGVPERVVTRWRLGEAGARVDLDTVDQVTTALELFWWEIWTEDTVREPMFVVTTYHHLWKTEKGKGRKLRRIKDRTIPYGDLGTDYWRLREIEALMVGEFVGVAA